MDRIKKKRLIFLIISVLLLFIEVMIALFIHDRFIRPYLGDVLVVILLYCIVKILFPERIKLLSLYVFAFACLTEFLQYFNIVKLLGLQNNPFFSTLIGTVFDWSDILCYGIGCAVLFLYDLIMIMKKGCDETHPFRT